jgi:hypothetical protein
MHKDILDTGYSKNTNDRDDKDSASTLKEKDIGREDHVGEDSMHDATFFSSIQTHGQPLSRPQTIHSTRSHRPYGGEDGYSCFEDDVEAEAEAEAGDQTNENKRFEVKWDGDSDPMNPKSRSKFRKWTVVFIMAGSALCVYARY